MNPHESLAVAIIDAHVRLLGRVVTSRVGEDVIEAKALIDEISDDAYDTLSEDEKNQYDKGYAERAQRGEDIMDVVEQTQEELEEEICREVGEIEGYHLHNVESDGLTAVMRIPGTNLGPFTDEQRLRYRFSEHGEQIEKIRIKPDERGRSSATELPVSTEDRNIVMEIIARLNTINTGLEAELGNTDTKGPTS